MHTILTLPQARPDLSLALNSVPLAVWEHLRNARVFVTGGTGFIGSWISRSFLHAGERLNLGAHMVLLVRDVEKARAENPDIANHPFVSFVQGDITSFDFPQGRFTHCLHLATQSIEPRSPSNALRKVQVNVAGTLRVLAFAAQSGVQRFLYTSSGAVYGPQPPTLSHLTEGQAFIFDPANPHESYAVEKRTCEFLCVQAGSAAGFETSIARCFAFVGPGLPLDSNYAVGNFIRDALSRRPITVQSDGSPWRSYLHAADLCGWLWTLLATGKHGLPVNVGSDEAVDILSLARLVGELAGSDAGVNVLGRPNGLPPQRYVPSIRRAQEEFGLNVTLPLRAALNRTITYYLNSDHNCRGAVS